MRTVRSLIWVALAGVIFLGLANSNPAVAAKPIWYVDEAALPFTPLAGATALWGTHAGAGYRIEVPNNWNGDLVMYAHGYRGTGPALTVSNPRIRAHLIANGYAWAASSYRENGYVPGLGAKDTHALAKFFGGKVGKPDRVYLTGHSMGGHVTGVAIEQWPKTFAGALPMCGVMGDNELFDYFQDVYLAAETLVGNVPAVPTPADYPTNGGPAALAAMGPAFPVALNATGERFKAVLENLTGGERPTFDQGWLGPHGGSFTFGLGGTGAGRENLSTVYQFDADPALSPDEQAFNDAIIRLAGDPQYRHKDGLGGVPGSNSVSPPISGDLPIPVLSLHTLGELFVPFHMQQIYATRAAAHGKADLLVVRAIRDVLHCGFTVEEESQAFDDLVQWVVNGVKPAGDDILNPVAVANPGFGCQFTTGSSPFRAGLPACP